MTGYLPWDKSWRRQIVYLPWFQPELPGMEDSPVLPAYPIFTDSLRRGLHGYDFFTAVASAMVFLLGHEPEAAINSLYCSWLRIFNGDLAVQLFYEGTEMTAKMNIPQAIWMLQASLLLDPYSYETNYNLALAFNYLADELSKEEKIQEAGNCHTQAEQYFRNASQLPPSVEKENRQEPGKGVSGTDERYDSGIHRGW